MIERPASVTVIGWLFKGGGVLGVVIALPFALWGPVLFGDFWADLLMRLSPVVLFLWAFLSSLLCILCGHGMLEGRNWARGVALGYCVFGTLMAAVLYKSHPVYWFNLTVDVAFTVGLWILLYRRHVTAFFRQETPRAA